MCLKFNQKHSLDPTSRCPKNNMKNVLTAPLTGGGSAAARLLPDGAGTNVKRLAPLV
jgi:hypothetical protein